ncbi:MAG: NAD(P)-dependent oxidoreductase [Candidatus Rokubacteria bacterium]|nr:NAD(P)-dependent oxidoreductase [Candidatus Rokubacteria bacterium]
MATNILKAGHTLTVYDADPAATKPLEQLGATRAADLPALAAASRVTLTSLPNDAVVEAVLFGSGAHKGLLDGAKAGDVIVDLSTVSPATTQRLAKRAAERGVTLVDAPVSGSVSGAVSRTLAVMVGAPAESSTAFDALLHAIGSHVFYLGEVGRGNVLKLLNNVCALTNQAVLCEALALGDRLGIPRETVGEVIGRSSGASFILERKLPALAKHDYRPGFFVELARKDLSLALGLAESAGAESSVARAAFALYDAATAAGHGRLDSSGLLAYLESLPKAGA